jgi:hypothetical protein
MTKPISHEAMDIAIELARGRLPAVEGARRIDALRGILEPWSPSVDAAKFVETIKVPLNTDGKRLVGLALDQFAAKKLAECMDPAVENAFWRFHNRAAQEEN